MGEGGCGNHDRFLMTLVDSAKNSTYLLRQVGVIVLFSCIILGCDR
jgi:hypothetical protein